MSKFCVILIILTAGFFMGASAQEMPETVRIGLISGFANRETIAVRSTHIEVGYEEGGIFVPLGDLRASGGFTARVNSAGQVVLYAGNNRVFTFDRAGAEAQLRAAGGELTRLGTSTYRGVIALMTVNRRLTAVNVICPEEYLFGVVPSEMTPGWHPQALMAQAVASRTFLINHLAGGTHAAQNFHLCDTTCCQVYRGIEREHANTTAAVNATRGTLILYDGQTITASYFSSSGGATDNSENVWVQARPYLRSVNSIAEYNPLQWERTFTWAQLTSLAAAANAGIGNVTGISISQVSASGRVQELTLFGTTGTHRITSSERIRSFFNAQGGWLPSRNFRAVQAAPVMPVVWVFDGHRTVQAPLSSFMRLDHGNNPAALHLAYAYDGVSARRIEAQPAIITGGTGVTFIGSGWGHGVGMSQHGAQGMALAGFTYREILMHYYTGVEITNW